MESATVTSWSSGIGLRGGGRDVDRLQGLSQGSRQYELAVTRLIPLGTVHMCSPSYRWYLIVALVADM
jgi:hypothetical protein